MCSVLWNPLKGIQAGTDLARKTTGLALQGAVATTKPMVDLGKRSITNPGSTLDPLGLYKSN